MKLQFTIPGEPKSKQRPRVTKAGITYTPKETVQYENWVKQCYIMEHFNEQLEGSLKATVTAYFTAPKSKPKKIKEQMLAGKIRPTRLDCDNIAKAVLDALNKLAYNDDGQVAELTVKKFYAEQPRVEVVLECLKN
jgi:Holliday junction resolvase RusA-like endonuclease